MVNELKTLKEIFWLKRLKMCGCGACSEGLDCDVERIKQEAIKWVKHYLKYEDGFPASGFQIDVEFIKFFNITEKEIK